MSANVHWKEMHDAVLLSIELEWRSDDVRMRIKRSGANQDAEIHFADVASLKIPRRLPWGGSSSINEFEVLESENGPLLMRIEIQSGDCIEMEAGGAEMMTSAT